MNATFVAPASSDFGEVEEMTGPFDLGSLGYKPVVIRGMANDWPLTQKLRTLNATDSIRYMVEHISWDRDIRIYRHNPQHRPRLSNMDICHNPDQAAQKLLESLWRPGEHAPTYIDAMASSQWQKLRSQMHPLSIGRSFGGSSNQVVWLGVGNRTTPFHFDESWNIASLISSRKRFTLVPPSVEAMRAFQLAPFSETMLGAASGRNDRLTPELAAQIAPLGTVSVLMEPGDVLVVPPLWWHHVATSGLCVMRNEWLCENGLSLELIEKMVSTLWFNRQVGCEVKPIITYFRELLLSQVTITEPEGVAYYEGFLNDLITYVSDPNVYGGGEALENYVMNLGMGGGRMVQNVGSSFTFPFDSMASNQLQVPESISLEFQNIREFYAFLSDQMPDGGIYIPTEDCPPTGTAITLDLQIGDTSLQLPCTVVWSNPNGQTLTPGFGVQFSQEAREALKPLGIFLSESEKRSPDLLHPAA